MEELVLTLVESASARRSAGKIQDYLDEAQALERELDERLHQIEPATRIDVVKGQLRDWRARLLPGPEA